MRGSFRVHTTALTLRSGQLLKYRHITHNPVVSDNACFSTLKSLPGEDVGQESNEEDDECQEREYRERKVKNAGHWGGIGVDVIAIQIHYRTGKCDKRPQPWVVLKKLASPPLD